MTPSEAKETLSRLGLSDVGDSDLLTWAQVDAVLAESDRVKYRKPANANGSRSRYFYERLRRAAARDA